VIAAANWAELSPGTTTVYKDINISNTPDKYSASTIMPTPEVIAVINIIVLFPPF
jgi:hypothetical protein